MTDTAFVNSLKKHNINEELLADTISKIFSGRRISNKQRKELEKYELVQNELQIDKHCFNRAIDYFFN